MEPTGTGEGSPPPDPITIERSLQVEPEKKTAQTEAEQTAPAEEKAPAAPEKEEKAAEKKSKKPKKNKEVEALEEQLAGCRQENSDLNDRLLRLRAEYDNFRKRSTKEKEGMFTDGVASALSQMVVVLDNLERAVDACQEDSDLKTGVEMTLKQFREVLEKMGVSEINPVGESFDAQLHNAVMHVEDETLGESQVVEVFQKGYLLGERVIRYAMVKVAN
ncbi:nucleotide exchange factor GrpE [Acetanaerobacterium sp. MSJ-12]|uniref:nucleotide exchange factor GrpE n=1 Tax=Acetanaerobacterium sp. MSJ-12 TaxID=2841535 RepID=UPI002570BCA7|nr:nucleotide exchange factor GrpE [Acetanaerobacterium sp. MSJ-12]